MKYALTQYFLFGTSLSGENYPGRSSRSHGVSTGILQILKPCEIQLSCSPSAPGRWERHVAAMACTPPAISGAKAAALSYEEELVVCYSTAFPAENKEAIIPQPMRSFKKATTIQRKMSNQKPGTQDWINLVRGDDSTTIEGNPYLISEAIVTIAFKQTVFPSGWEYTKSTLFLNLLLFFFPLTRKCCHTTCLVWAWIKKKKRHVRSFCQGKVLTQLLEKPKMNILSWPNQCSFHYLYSWIQQLQVTLQVTLSEKDKESDDALKFGRLVCTPGLSLCTSRHCCANASSLQV